MPIGLVRMWMVSPQQGGEWLYYFFFFFLFFLCHSIHDVWWFFKCNSELGKEVFPSGCRIAINCNAASLIYKIKSHQWNFFLFFPSGLMVQLFMYRWSPPLWLVRLYLMRILKKEKGIYTHIYIYFWRSYGFIHAFHFVFTTDQTLDIHTYKASKAWYRLSIIYTKSHDIDCWQYNWLSLVSTAVLRWSINQA